jgi:multiple sugar transport system substrate-binding protein
MKMRSMKILVSIVLLAAVLIGCKQGKGSSNAAAEKTADAPYELSVAWWGGEARHKKTLEMIDRYTAKFPNVKVVSQYAAFSDYWTKLSTQAAGGNMPDAYLVQLSYVGEYASKGLMRPLQDLVDAGKIDVSTFTKGALSGSSYDGKLVGITFGDTASIMVYNKSILDSVGYPPPKNQMSYSEYATYLKGLVPLLPKGTYASDVGARHEHMIENFSRQHGFYGVTSEDGKQLGYSKEVLAKFLGFYYDLFKAGVCGPLETILEDRNKQWGDSLAGKGKLVCWYTNANQGKIFQASLEDELGMARTPVADNATRKYAEVAVCSTWAISGKTSKVDEAAQFINFMVNDWDSQAIYNGDIGVPGSTVIQDKLIARLDLSKKVDVVYKQEIERIQDILNTIEPFNGRPSGFGAVYNDVYSKMDEILFGRMTVQQAVDAHFEAAKTLLQ